MAVVAVALLVVGVSGTIVRPWRLPAWLFSLAAAVVAVAAGVTGLADVRTALGPLVEPIAFLLLAVPLAVALDELGVFRAAASVVAGRRVGVGMWMLCGVAVAVLNLDAAVVLCTPLAIAVARHRGLDPVAMAFQPALLACLASSALPVSNLTNLIAVSQGDVSAATLTAGLLVPTLAACAVGYVGWRVAFRHRRLTPLTPEPRTAPDRRPLVLGAVVVGVLLVGFLVGGAVGLPAWVVVAVVNVGVFSIGRRVPWSAIPWGTAAVAAGLAVVAAAAADRTGLAERLAVDGTWRQALVGAGAANVLNNLPAFLLASPHTQGSDQVLALLLGVNIGPTVLVTGSLSGLLWLDAARRSGLDVHGHDYARVGLICRRVPCGTVIARRRSER